MRYFRVSGTGNGVGVAVIRTGDAQEIILRVHPKVWRQADALIPGLVRLRPEGARSVFTVYELDTIEVSSEIADALAVGRELVLGSDERLSGDESESRSSLLTEVAPPSSVLDVRRTTEIDSPQTENQDQAMWTLVGAMDHFALRDSYDLPAVLASSSVSRQRQLRRLFLEEFTKLAAEAVLYQRSEFRRNSGPLMAVRGKILVNNLVDRKAYRRQAIACEYTELNTDTTLWKTIRAAVRQCLTELGTSTYRSRAARERALRTDAHLSSVSVTSPISILQNAPLAHFELPPGSPQRAYEAARALLSQATGFGTTPGQHASAVSINIATSSLWEEVLRRRFISAGYTVESRVSKLRLFENTLMPKRPDIELRNSSGEKIVVDAKYKIIHDLAPGRMSMSDQYQMYAYATQRESPTIFIHVGESGCEWTNTSASGTGGSYPVGVASLPFPSPESLLPTTAEGLESEVVSKKMISTLETGPGIVEGLGPHNRSAPRCPSRPRGGSGA